MSWQYVKMCPSCRVPLLWLFETPEFLGKKTKANGACRRCWRRDIEYRAIPSGCLHIWEERHA